MNIQKVFEAVRDEPDQSTLIVAVNELERQGYKVIINERYNGSKDLILAGEKNELRYLTHINGVIIKTLKNEEVQNFRIHYLDIDAIAFTDVKSLPVQYNPKYTIELFTQG